MPYSGAGVFSLVAGNPVVTGTSISSTWANNTLSDIATNGLTNALTKDGQTTPTANLPMGNFKLTGMGVGSSATDSVRLGQVQAGAMFQLGTVVGTNTITAVAAPVITAYATGQTFRFIPANTTTGAATINIDGLGAKNIFLNGGALTGGEIRQNVPCEAFYDGTQFNIIGPFAGGAVPGRLDLGAVSANTTAGIVKASSAGGFLSTGVIHELRTSGSNIQALIVSNNSATNPFGLDITFSNAAPNDTTRYFFQGADTGGERITGRSNGGLANYSANNVNLSDIESKEALEAFIPDWDKAVAVLRSIQFFKYADATNKSDLSSWCCSPMAQDVEVHYPEYVVPFNANDPNSLKGVREQPLMWELIGTITDKLDAVSKEFDAYKVAHP